MQEHHKIAANSEPIAYSPQRAAETSGLSLRYVMKAISGGKLRSFKKGRRRIILREDLEAYLRSVEAEY
jgi:excisionase family DNA binding protein